MLNGEGNERGTKNCIKINSKKNKFARAACFLSFFSVVLHNYNAVL